MLRRRSASLAALAMLLACACADDEPTRPDRPLYLPPTSPENVLQNLATAHRRMDIDAYDAQFHEQFRFLVSPYDDIGVEYFDRVEDHYSTENMFNNIDDVEIALANTGSVPSDSSDPEYSAATGHMQILVPSAFLTIQTREMQGGEPIFLQVPGHPHLFVFRPDSTADPVTWSIVLWVDQNIGAGTRAVSTDLPPREGDAQVRDMSWSTVKANFRSYLPRTSPEHVLRNLETAHRRMDIDAYDAQFHEQFRFLVSPYDDIGVEYFDRVEDHYSTENMFNNIDDVEIALANTGSVPSEDPDPEYSAATGHMQIFVPSAFLMIQTREMQGGEPIFLQVPGHPHLFVFRPDSTADPVTWSIVLWVDQNTGLGAWNPSGSFLLGEGDAQTEDTSWSTIKNLYR